jgi:hypothetical protein
MIGKIAGVVALGYIYRTLRKPFTDHAFYKVGLIDADGNKTSSFKKGEMNPDQTTAFTNFNSFTWRIKRLLKNNKVFSISLMGAIASSIFLRENSNNSTPFVLFEDGTLGVIDENGNVISENGETDDRYTVLLLEDVSAIANNIGDGKVALVDKPMGIKKRKKLEDLETEELEVDDDKSKRLKKRARTED